VDNTVVEPIFKIFRRKSDFELFLRVRIVGKQDEKSKNAIKYRKFFQASTQKSVLGSKKLYSWEFF